MNTTTIPTVEVLRKARALIEKPEAWVKEHFAVKADGQDTHYADADAVRFCVAGALRRVEDQHGLAYEILRQAARCFGSICEWNDAPERTHAEVLAAFDKAIAIAEKTDHVADIDRDARATGPGPGSDDRGREDAPETERDRMAGL